MVDKNRISEAQEKAKARAAAASNSPITRAAQDSGALNSEEESLLNELSFRLKNFSGESIDISRREELLAKAIQVNTKIQATGNLSSKKESLDRLKSVKGNIDERQIGLGDEKRDEFLKLYDSAIQQTENNISLTSDLGKSFKNTVQSNIPTAEDFTTALTAENPLFGAATGFFKDLVVDRLMRVKGEREERAAALEALSEEAMSHAAVIETESLKQGEILEQSKDRKEKKSGKAPLVERMQGVLDSNLRVEDAMNKLLRIWDDAEPEESNENIERVEENIKELVNVQKEVLETQQNKIEKEEIASADDRFDMIEEARESGIPDIGDNATNKKGGIGDLFGKGAKGIMSGISGFLKGFGKLGAKLIGFAPLITGAIGFAAKMFGVFTAIFGFIKGFVNAADILDIPEGDLTVGDKISAGIGGAFGSLFGIVDTILGLFGVDSNIGEFVQGFVGKTLVNLKNGIVGSLSGFVQGFSDFGNNLFEAFSDPKKLIIEMAGGEDSRFGQILSGFASGDTEIEGNSDRISASTPRVGANEIEGAKAKAEAMKQTTIINNQTNNITQGGGGSSEPVIITPSSPRTSENTIRRSNDRDFAPAM